MSSLPDVYLTVLGKSMWIHIDCQKQMQLTLLILRDLDTPLSVDVLIHCIASHQHSWYSICRVNGILSSTIKDFNYQNHFSVEK